MKCPLTDHARDASGCSVISARPAGWETQQTDPYAQQHTTVGRMISHLMRRTSNGTSTTRTSSGTTKDATGWSTTNRAAAWSVRRIVDHTAHAQRGGPRRQRRSSRKGRGDTATRQQTGGPTEWWRRTKRAVTSAPAANAEDHLHRREPRIQPSLEAQQSSTEVHTRGNRTNGQQIRDAIRPGMVGCRKRRPPSGETSGRTIRRWPQASRNNSRCCST